jgi:hypothetical protein
MQYDAVTGQISQKTGVAPGVFARTEFKLSVNNPVNDLDTTFALEVALPAENTGQRVVSPSNAVSA